MVKFNTREFKISLSECPRQNNPFAHLSVLTEIPLKCPTFKLIFKMMSKKKKKQILDFIKQVFKSVIMESYLVVRSVVQKNTPLDFIVLEVTNYVVSETGQCKEKNDFVI